MSEDKPEYKTHYSARDLAKESGLTVQRIGQLIRAGVIPANKVGNSWVISATAARRWLAEYRPT